MASTTASFTAFATPPEGMPASTLSSNGGVYGVAAVKWEKLAWLADRTFYTKRFAFFVGRYRRATTISGVARELHLDWRAVKEPGKHYMHEPLRRIVVSDQSRRRPIWFGGCDRAVAGMASRKVRTFG